MAQRPCSWRTKETQILLMVIFTFLFTSRCYSQTILYVDAAAVGANNGSSWSNAYTTLKTALDEANVASGAYEIRVAQGTYYPTGVQSGTDRDATFAILRAGIRMYGGFNAGTGNRNVTANLTTLSGDINTASDDDNSYHVMVIVGISAVDSIVVDGFTITKGKANGSATIQINSISLYRGNAGGIFGKDNATGSKIKLSQCHFTNNSASYGGGMYNTNSSITLSSCIFTNNNVSSLGGGIYNDASSPNLFNCIFSGNSSNFGGGLYNFAGNPTLVNCVFNSNTGQEGGGLNSISGNPEIINCTFYGNNGGIPSAIFNLGGFPVIANGIFWGNTGTALSSDLNVSYSIVQGGYPGIGNSNADPFFVNASDPDGTDNIWGTADDGLAFQPWSSAANIGNNAVIPPGISTDITGVDRIYNAVVDLGAYELQMNVDPCLRYNSTIYVDQSVTVSGDGSSWSSAIKYLDEALTIANGCGSVNTILVAQGTYYPTGVQSGTDRDATFAILRAGIRMYGGYNASTGQRNLSSNITTLSGAINTESDDDNSYHVMVIVGISAVDSIVVDGFTFSKGRANGSGSIQLNSKYVNRQCGGGIYMTQNSTTVNIRLNQCIATGNTANSIGGGIYCYNSSHKFNNCIISGNTSNDLGGGIYHNGSPEFNNCIFSGNAATNHGGGIYNSNGSPEFNNCIFSGNTAHLWGGGIVNDDGSPKIKNCAISGNSASKGGGMYISSGNIQLINNVFYNNMAYETGGAIWNQGNSTITNCTFGVNASSVFGISTIYSAHSPVISNSIFWGNTGTALSSGMNVSYSIVQGGYPGTGNSNADPFFVNASDPDGTDNIWGTADDGLALMSNSPAVNTGNNDAIPAGITTDIIGANRIANNTVDMGAYEYGSFLPISLLYFRVDKIRESTGLTWSTASEQDSKGFDIQRSTDGKKWSSITFVPSKADGGNSFTVLNYDYIDDFPVSGMNYYRLKQVDHNGQYQYSSIRTVYFDSENIVHVYPNPTHGLLTLEYTGLASTRYSIIHSNSEIVREGTMDEKKIDVSHLPAGVYYLIWQDNLGETHNKRFVKVD